jgi:outer membrane protein assembly factor BamB
MKSRSIAGLLLAVSLLWAADIALADWPQFRGPTGQGISAARRVPLAWSATENVAWKVAVPGSGWSSPVLAGGRLYVTTAVAAGDAEQNLEDAATFSLRAICLDATDGRIVWDVEAMRADAEAAKPLHSKNSLASPTPIVDSDRVFVHFGHMGTAALDLEGNVLWRQTNVEYSPVHGNGGSPALVEDMLVFSCDGAEEPFLVALDRTTGEVRWKTPRRTSAKKTFAFSTPLVINMSGGQQIVSPASGHVGAYDPRTGRELWRVRYGEGYSVIPRPVTSQGLLVLSSGFDRPAIYTIRLPDGRSADDRGDMTETHVAWRHNKAAPNTPSPIVVGDELYFVSDSGIASCLDLRKGKVHWSERLGGAFSASPVAAEGRLYFLSEQGVCYVVAARREFKLLATNDLGDRTFASPAVDDGALFIRSESHLWRIGDKAEH